MENDGAAVSRIQRRLAGSTTTLWTVQSVSSGRDGLNFINCRIWKGNDLAVANLSHCVRHVITPPRKVDEDAPVLRDGHAGGRRFVEFEYRLDRPMVRSEASCPADGVEAVLGPIRPRRSVIFWLVSPKCVFITRPLTPPGSIKSKSGSPKFSETSSPGASSVRSKISLAKLCAISAPTIAKQHPLNGLTKTPPIALKPLWN